MNIFINTTIDKINKFNSLKYLRIIAAMSVILFHIEKGINTKYWVWINILNSFFGVVKVSLFFVFQICNYSSYIRPKNV